MKDFPYSTGPSSELIDCLEAKQKAIEQFVTMTETLRDRLITQDLAEVERLLNQRQGLIRTIDRMDDYIQTMKARHSSDRGWPREGEKKKVSWLVNRIRELSEKARAIDKECTDRMSGWRDQVKSDLSRMRESLRAVHGYALRPMRPPKFLDVIR